jgi:hypothetical protein
MAESISVVVCAQECVCVDLSLLYVVGVVVYVYDADQSQISVLVERVSCAIC